MENNSNNNSNEVDKQLQQPFLEDQTPPYLVQLRSSNNNNINSFTSSFVADEDDIGPITGVRDFFREFMVESRKLWYLAGPAIFTSICQYSLGAITQTFAGQLSTIDLAAFSVENSVIAGFSFGVMVSTTASSYHILLLLTHNIQLFFLNGLSYILHIIRKTPK